MKFLTAYKHMMQGKIARHDRSFYCLHEGYLCRVHSKSKEIMGMATVTGDIFASDSWWLLDETPKKESKKWTL